MKIAVVGVGYSFTNWSTFAPPKWSKFTPPLTHDARDEFLDHTGIAVFL